MLISTIPTMSSYKYFLVYKPYGVLPQFRDEGGRPTLASLGDFPAEVYPVGRLDMDSEGLLLLTDDKALNHRLLNPRFAHSRRYLVQVDGDITPEGLQQLRQGVEISVDGKKYRTAPAQAEKLEQEPQLPDRDPPVRFRKNIPTSFILLTLTEGKNRQVRKMTAAAGFPTLRLLRVGIEALSLEGMQPGEVRPVQEEELFHALFGKARGQVLFDVPRSTSRSQGRPSAGRGTGRRRPY